MLKCVYSIGNAKGDGGATRLGVQYVVAVLGPGVRVFSKGWLHVGASQPWGPLGTQGMYVGTAKRPGGIPQP